MKKKILLALCIGWLAACSAWPSATTPISNTTPVPVSSATPVAWSSLGLTGKLIFTRGNTGGVARLDLASGALTTLFQPPSGSWALNESTVSPDRQQIVISYAPPFDPTQMQFGYTNLYQLPLDGSAPPECLIEVTDPYESYSMPAWSPDGRYLYYVHSQPVYGENGQPMATNYWLERRVYPAGQPERILENALSPRISPDGSKLVYLPAFPLDDPNELYLANADGTEVTPLLADGPFTRVDMPLFSPDGQTIFFNAAGDNHVTPEALTWLDQLFGVQIAYAHPNAAEWWQVRVTGGAPKAVTQYDFSTVNMPGAFSADGRQLFFTTLQSLYVMDSNGTSLIPLLDLKTAGTVDWIP